jgi:hypothetical protein
VISAISKQVKTYTHCGEEPKSERLKGGPFSKIKLSPCHVISLANSMENEQNSDQPAIQHWAIQETN